MEQENRIIPIYCMEEHMIIGNLVLPGEGAVQLTPSFIWSTFEPVSDSYRLPPEMPREGKRLMCPKCLGALCLDIQDVEPETVEAKREKLKRETIERLKNERTITVNGRTYVMGESHHIDSVPQSASKLPIVLGRTKIDSV